jgi:hypothetical protein
MLFVQPIAKRVEHMIPLHPKPPRAQYPNGNNVLRFPLKRPHKADDALAYAELTSTIVLAQASAGTLHPEIMRAFLQAAGLPT